MNGSQFANPTASQAAQQSTKDKTHMWTICSKQRPPHRHHDTESPVIANMIMVAVAKFTPYPEQSVTKRADHPNPKDMDMIKVFFLLFGLKIKYSFAMQYVSFLKVTFGINALQTNKCRQYKLYGRQDGQIWMNGQQYTYTENMIYSN